MLVLIKVVICETLEGVILLVHLIYFQPLSCLDFWIFKIADLRNCGFRGNGPLGHCMLSSGLALCTVERLNYSSSIRCSIQRLIKQHCKHSVVIVKHAQGRCCKRQGGYCKIRY